jgi:hypothetical protein
MAAIVSGKALVRIVGKLNLKKVMSRLALLTSDE